VKTLKLALFAGALTSVAAVALAQTATPPTAPEPNAAAEPAPKAPPRLSRLARLDANKDGAVDQQEFSAAQKLKEADANSDGTLSAEELTAFVQKQELERKVERLTRRLDIDGDGKVTLAEIEKNKAEHFALLDRNDDGKLEGRELRGGKHFKHRKGDHGGHHRGPGDGGPDMDL
jgi:Ca2+-binding EF-hand superfamily protein